MPKLTANCVIVIDNASFHKRAGSREAIEKAGHNSPDLNPIEHNWAQLKSIRRKIRGSIDEIFQYL